MTALIIGAILTVLSVVASLYQLHMQSNEAAEARSFEYWWMTWPM